MEHNEGCRLCRTCITAEERVLWHGAPDPGHSFAGIEPEKIRAGLLLSLAAAPFAILPVVFGQSWEICIFGFFILTFGLVVLLGKPLYNLILRKKTYYVITNKKIIQRKGNHIITLRRECMLEPRVRYYRNGNGSIMLTSGIVDTYRRGRKRHVTFGEDPFTLENLPDVVDAEAAIANMDP